MKVTIESTTKIVTLNGIPCRVWEGKTERGVAIQCFISRISVAVGLDDSQLQAELEQQAAPSPEAESFPLRMVI